MMVKYRLHLLIEHSSNVVGLFDGASIWQWIFDCMSSRTCGCKLDEVW